MAAKRQIITLKTSFGIRFFFLPMANGDVGTNKGDANIQLSGKVLVIPHWEKKTLLSLSEAPSIFMVSWRTVHYSHSTADFHRRRGRLRLRASQP
jgi:hypothetical protein